MRVLLQSDRVELKSCPAPFDFPRFLRLQSDRVELKFEKQAEKDRKDEASIGPGGIEIPPSPSHRPRARGFNRTGWN